MITLLRAGRGRYQSARYQVRQVGRAVNQLADLGSLHEMNAEFSGRLTRLEATQALLARMYERSFDWSAELDALRNEHDYAAPWEAEQPLITVRIATYNNAEVLMERALASVLRQTYPHWEAIVVGDACTDDTAERIAALDDPRVRFVNLETRGPYPLDEESLWLTAGTYPMNRGLELARGLWIASLDHDDAWDDDHLEVLLAHARRTRAEVVYAKWRMVDAEIGRQFDCEFGGEFPPFTGAIAFQTSLCHGKLSRFRFDPHAYLAGEPGDRNLARRLYEVGVRFAALDRAVMTYWFSPRSAWGRRHLISLRQMYGYLPGHV